MYNIFLRNGTEIERDAVMRAMDDDGIETRPVFYPMHVMPPYLQKSNFPIADEWAQRGINLPTHTMLSKTDVHRILESRTKALDVL
jgi:perosamine synthetase